MIFFLFTFLIILVSNFQLWFFKLSIYFCHNWLMGKYGYKQIYISYSLSLIIICDLFLVKKIDKFLY